MLMGSMRDAASKKKAEEQPKIFPSVSVLHIHVHTFIYTHLKIDTHACHITASHTCKILTERKMKQLNLCKGWCSKVILEHQETQKGRFTGLMFLPDAYPS